MSLIILSFLVVTLKRYLAYAAQADLNASGVVEEISTHRVMKNGTHLFGNVISAIMAHRKSLMSNVTVLLEFWECSTGREHLAGDGCTGPRDWDYALWVWLDVYPKNQC